MPSGTGNRLIFVYHGLCILRLVDFHTYRKNHNHAVNMSGCKITVERALYGTCTNINCGYSLEQPQYTSARFAQLVACLSLRSGVCRFESRFWHILLLVVIFMYW